MHDDVAPDSARGRGVTDVRRRTLWWRAALLVRAAPLAGALLAGAAVLMAACGGGSGSGLSTALDDSSEDDHVSISDSLPDAPDFPGGHTWFNVGEPLTLEELRGKVVLLDFWTSGCINCQHIIPDLKRLEDEYGDALVVIGVHSGKYDREQDDASVQQAILRFGLEHPVVNDPDFIIWSSYSVNAWPTLVLIDPAGKIVGGRAGEGIYGEFQPVIDKLVADFDAQDLIDRTPIAIDLEAAAVTSAVLSYPAAVFADEAGDRLFIADAGRNRVLIADLSGALVDVIGSGERGLEDGIFAEASLNEPQGLALSADGSTLYIADTRNHAVRAADLETREITTIAGTGVRAYRAPATSAAGVDTELASPWGLLLRGSTLYMAMAGTHQIWTLDLETGTVSAFAGSGAEGIADGPLAVATLAQPSGMATDGTTLYWVDPESSSVRRLPLDGGGDVSTLVGTGLFDFGDADGEGLAAQLEHPAGIAYANGLLYVADTYNHKLRTVDPATLNVVTVAGGDGAGFHDGELGASLLSEPLGMSVAGNLVYFADRNNHVVRTLDTASSAVATLQLTNLSVIAESNQDRPLTVALAGQTVAPDATELRIRFTSPAGFHLNSLAPSELALSSSNTPALQPEEDIVTWATDEETVEVVVPVNVETGEAILAAEGSVYYCRTGDEALCLIANLQIALPVTVDAAAIERVIALDYELSAPAVSQ